MNKYNPPSYKFHRTIKEKFSKISKNNILCLNSNDITYTNGNVFYKNSLLRYDVCTCLIGFNIDKKFYLNNNINLIKINNKFFVQTTPSYQTNYRNIFAIGEIVLKPENNSLGNTRAYIEHTNTILNRIFDNIKY